MNENLSNVEIEKESLPRVPFNVSKKLNTTFGFGECQPVLARCIDVAQSTSEFSIDSLVRLAPLVAPSFADIRLKQYFSFIPLKDLYKHADALLAHVPVTLATQSDPNTYYTGYVNEFPKVDNNILLYFLLRDARCCCYMYNSSGNYYGLVTQTTDSIFDRVFSNLHSWYKAENRWSPIVFTSNNINDAWNPAYGDYQFHYTEGSNDVIYTFKLSDNAKRLRKIFIGLGYRPSFYNGVYANQDRIHAWYKMYFDLFNLPQYDNYLDTYAYKCLDYFDRFGSADLSMLRATEDYEKVYANLFYHFITDELSYCFYTDNKDYVSAHISTTSLPARDVNEFQNAKFVDPSGNTYLEQDHFTDRAFGSTTNQMQLSELDDKLLKKMFKWVNQESSIGYDIASILRALGYDDYVETCKSNFIGSTDQRIEISPVISQAGTDSKKLGDYAGYGSSYEAGHKFKYNNDEIGFLMGIGCVVPESEYNSALDPQLLGNDRYTFGKDFDGYGYEATPRACVGSVQVMATNGRMNNDRTTFGYVPVGTHRKVSGGNILNGDMSLLSMRNSFAPYQLDRMIYENPEEYVFQSAGIFKASNLPSSTDFPQASKVWRFLTRYPFLGNFNRIFYNGGSRTISIDPTTDYKFSGMTDNFYMHGMVNLKIWSSQLPISSTWQTIEDPSDKKRTITIKN